MKKMVNQKSAFKSKPVAAAIGLAMGALVATNAQAVNVSSDGLGDVLLFPYYTVNNGYDTNINITNTSDNTVVFKIRFRESQNSRDARDFNVILSPYDVWNASITQSPDQDTARLVTADTTCTAGLLPIDLGNGRRAVDFTNYDYITSANTSSGPNDQGPTGMDRAKEGHIEIIQMGVQLPTNPGAASPDLVFAPGSVGENAQHVNGVPRDCNAVRNAFSAGNLAATQAAFDEPLNVLKGSATLLKADEGKAISVEPTVLANFYNPDLTGIDGADIGNFNNLIVSPEDQNPSLNQVSPANAVVLSDDGSNAVVGTGFTAPVDAVSAVLSRASVVNQYSVNPANNAATDWVVTFPTKYFYVDEREAGVNPGVALAPFDAGTTFQEGNGCASVEVAFRFFDREEDEQISVSNVGFSPAPPGVGANEICYETQVLTFDQSNLLGSPLSANVPVGSAGFTKGWMDLVFTQAGDLVGGATFTGLPVIGFSATTLENGTAGDFMLNYGFSAQHGYTRNITTP